MRDASGDGWHGHARVAMLNTADATCSRKREHATPEIAIAPSVSCKGTPKLSRTPKAPQLDSRCRAWNRRPGGVSGEPSGVAPFKT